MTRLLSDSPLVERLGWVLLHSVWQFTAVAAALFVVLLVLRRASATVRYVAGLLALGAMVAAPAATWTLMPDTGEARPAALIPPDSAPLPSAVAELPAAELLPSLSTTLPETPPLTVEMSHSEVVAQHPAGTALWDQAIERRLRPWLPSIVLAWCLGVLAFALRPLVSWHRLRRLRRYGLSAAPDEVEARFRGLAQRLGVRRGVSLVQSALVQVPVVVGYLRPAILLPVSVLAEMPASQLEAILAHELAHVRRHDFLVNLVQTLVETVFFYHPVVWWVSRQIRNEREHCCDDLAVAACGDRSEYGRALLALEELRGATPALALGVQGGSLLARIRRLLSVEALGASPIRQWTSGAAAASVVLFIGIAVGLWLLGQSRSVGQDSVEKPTTTDAETAFVTGRVLDDQQKPIAGAAVGLQVWNFQEQNLDPRGKFAATGKADKNGHFRLVVPAKFDRKQNLATVWSIAPGYQAARPNSYGLLQGLIVEEATVTLTSAPETVVQVLSPDGRPVQDVRVNVIRQRLPESVAFRIPDDWLDQLEGTTDAEGLVRLDHVVPAALAEVLLQPAGGVAGVRLDQNFFLNVRPAESGPRFTWKLPQTGTIAGRLAARDVELPAGLTLSVETESQLTDGPSVGTWGQADIAIDADGRFRIEGMPAGPVVVPPFLADDQPLRAEVPSQLVVRAGEATELTIPVSRGVLVRGLIRKQDTGEGYPQFRLGLIYGPSAREHRDMRSMFDLETDAEGRFEAHVPHGPIELRLRSAPEGYRDVEWWGPNKGRWGVKRDVPAGVESFELEPIDLVPAVTVQGKLVDADGKELGGWSLSGFPDLPNLPRESFRMNSVAAHTDEKGGFDGTFPQTHPPAFWQASHRDWPTPYEFDDDQWEAKVLSSEPLVLQVEYRTTAPADGVPADGMAGRFKPFDCLLVDPATGDPLPGDGFTIHFLFKLPATADAPEDTIDNLIWGPKATSRFQFIIPERTLKHPDRDKLVVQWGVGHPDYETLSPEERVPLGQILRDDPKSARDTFRRIAMQRKKPQAGAMPQSSRIVVKYDVADAEPRTRIYVRDVTHGRDIGTEEYGPFKFNPLQNGDTLTLPDLDPGDYQVARYRQVEIGKAGQSAIHTGAYLESRQIKLVAGETQSIEFVRPNGKRVTGRVTGLQEFGLEGAVVSICSENALDAESPQGRDVICFDALRCDPDGNFTTERLTPGNYAVLVKAYAPFKQEDLATTGRPVPRYEGSARFTVPESGDAPAVAITLRDTQAPAAADANPPANSRVVVHYDIPGAEPEARVFLQDLDRKLDIGSVVEGPMKWNPLKNGETLELANLEPGNYQVARRRLVEIGRVGDEILRNSIYFDRRPFALAAGETKRIDITRPNGKPVTGRVPRMKDLGVERAIVYACSDNATDAESPSRLDVTIFDVQPCDTDGDFVTERLSPGDYVLVVRGYTAIPPEVLSRTGDIPPQFVGTARVTVPEAGEPSAVEVTLKDTGDGTDDETVSARLDKEVDYEAENKPLIFVLSELEQAHNVPVTVSLKELLARGISAQTPVSINAANVALRSVLKNVLDQAGLDFEVTRQGVRIPSSPAADARVAKTVAGAAAQTQAAAVAAIEKLGGEVQYDESSPDRPVISVRLFENAKVADDDLQALKPLTSLLEVVLTGTRVTDAGLAHLSGLTRLGMLDLTKTRVTDAGLVHLKDLPRLEYLLLQGTGVSDAGLAHVEGLERLVMLSLGGTPVTDAGLAHLQGLSGLYTLNLEGTRITDAGLEQLTGLSSLVDLRLSDTAITSAGLKQLSGLTSLKTLVLNSTRIDGDGMAHLQPLQNLEKLWLVETHVDDAGLEHLHGLASLRELVLGNKTRVTRAGVQALRAALPECRIEASFPDEPQTSIRFNVFDQTGKQPLAQFRVIPGYRRMQGDLEQPTWQENDARRGREGELLWPLAELLSEETAFLVEAEGYKPQVWTWIKKSEGPKDLVFLLAKQPLGGLLLDCQLVGGAAEYTFHWNLSEPAEPRPGRSPESRDVKAANGRQTEVRNLIPGKYQLWRVRPVRFPDFTRNYGLDYREVQVVAGEQTPTRFVRGAGHRVRGRIMGLQDLVGPFGGGGGEGPGQEHDRETLACVLVRAENAPDPETSRGGFRERTFDAAPSDPDGRFVTEPLEPGTYKLYAHAYRRLTPQERVRTGDILPSWVGTVTVTVPKDHEPEEVEIRLAPFRDAVDESP